MIFWKKKKMNNLKNYINKFETDIYFSKLEEGFIYFNREEKENFNKADEIIKYFNKTYPNYSFTYNIFPDYNSIIYHKTAE